MLKGSACGASDTGDGLAAGATMAPKSLNAAAKNAASAMDDILFRVPVSGRKSTYRPMEGATAEKVPICGISLVALWVRNRPR